MRTDMYTDGQLLYAVALGLPPTFVTNPDCLSFIAFHYLLKQSDCLDVQDVDAQLCTAFCNDASPDKTC